MQTKLKEIDLFEEKEKRLNTESELARLPFLLNFLKEKLLIYKMQRAGKIMTDGLRTYSKISSLKEIRENKELVSYLGTDGSFKPALKLIEKTKPEDKVALVSKSIKNLGGDDFVESYKYRRKDMDEGQEQNNLWRKSNGIMGELVEKSWVNPNSYITLSQIKRPESYQYALV